MKNNDSAKSTKQRCEDCNRPTTHAYKMSNGNWIFRCNRCKRSRDGKF